VPGSHLLLTTFHKRLAALCRGLQGLASKIVTLLEMYSMHIMHVSTLLGHGSGSPSLCLFANCAGRTGQWGGLHNLQDTGQRTTVNQTNWLQALYAHLITLQTCQGLSLVQVAAPCQLVGILKGLAIGKQKESLLLDACAGMLHPFTESFVCSHKVHTPSLWLRSTLISVVHEALVKHNALCG